MITDSKRGTRVLVIDCNVDAAEILGILLEAHGFEVKVECGKFAALQAAPSFRPDSVIIDLGKETLDTYEVAAAIRSMPELQGVFLVTLTDGSLPTPILRNEAKIDAPLIKPTGYRILIDTLKRRTG